MSSGDRPMSDREPVTAGTEGVELLELGYGRLGEATDLLTDAFLDDPAVIAVGPDRRVSRRRVLWLYHWMAVRGALRSGKRQWCAVSGGKLAGVAITLPGEVGPPLARTVFLEALLFLPAGPASAFRRAQASTTTQRGYPSEPHVLLLFLATRADARRRGIGRLLLGRVIEDASAIQAPVVLDTTRASNIDYYRAFGFRQIGEASLPRGARVWFMIGGG